MSLKAREQHVLNAIEDELAKSDPRMSLKLGTFNRLSAGEAFPAREQIRSSWNLLCGQLAWPMLWLAICIAVITIAIVVAHEGGGGKGACLPQPAACAGSAMRTVR